MRIIEMKKIFAIQSTIVFTILLFISCNNSKPVNSKNQNASLKIKTDKYLSALILDFENKDKAQNVNSKVSFYAFTDENENPKGTSTINEVKRDLKNKDNHYVLLPIHEKGKGAYNSDGFIRISGNVTTACKTGYVGCGFHFNTDKIATDISSFKGIKFWARGSGVPFVVQLESSIVKDYAYHGCQFFADNDWEEFVIPFDDFRQPGWKSKQVNLKDILKSVLSIQWQTDNRPIENYFLCLDNIELIK
jgi:Complex I intermediate-associated protein 30 (CIA30)